MRNLGFLDLYLQLRGRIVVSFSALPSCGQFLQVRDPGQRALWRRVVKWKREGEALHWPGDHQGLYLLVCMFPSCVASELGWMAQILIPSP